MEIFLDCLPCLLRQALEASRMTTKDHELQEKIMADTVKVIAEYKKYRCAPHMCMAIHQIIKKLTGVEDPYMHIKERDIKAAQKIYPQLSEFLQKKENSLYWALKTAATGNIIDAALYSDVDVAGCFEKELEKEFSICDIDIFAEKLTKAKRLLIIGDNAGETVFDRILAEHLQDVDIIYAVRSEPILNDATIEDAYASGLDNCTTIISTGCNTPGVIIEQCSTEFLKVFNSVDIVLSKGQGNYEALSDQYREMFFLLKAKCPMIAERLSVPLNDYVFMFKEKSS